MLRLGLILATIAALIIGCAPTPRSGTSDARGSEGGVVGAAKLKRITAAIRGAPLVLSNERSRGIFVRTPGLDALSSCTQACRS